MQEKDAANEAQLEPSQKHMMKIFLRKQLTASSP